MDQPPDRPGKEGLLARDVIKRRKKDEASVLAFRLPNSVFDAIEEQAGINFLHELRFDFVRSWPGSFLLIRSAQYRTLSEGEK